MPTGEVVWYDKSSGEGRIRRNGRVYPALKAEMERAARVPRARVHFDIDRAEGIEWAVNVTLRRGTRGSPHHHRFGDLAGGKRPDAKGHHPLSRDHPGTDPSYEGRPVELIHEWVELINRKDLSTARLLYAPQATARWGDETVVGRDAIVYRLQDELAGLSIQGDEVKGTVKGAVVRTVLSGRRLTIRFEVEHGQIARQVVQG